MVSLRVLLVLSISASASALSLLRAPQRAMAPGGAALPLADAGLSPEIEKSAPALEEAVQSGKVAAFKQAALASCASEYMECQTELTVASFTCCSGLSCQRDVASESGMACSKA